MSQDSTNQNPITAPALNFKNDLIEAFKYLKAFLQSPVESIRQVPDWHWKILCATAAIVAVAFGAIGGLVKLKITSIIAGAIVFPIGTLIVVGTLSGLMYYSALFLFNTKLDFKKVCTISFLACLPWIVAGPVVDMLPPLKPLAVLASGFLAIVGFTDNTPLHKGHVTKLVGGIVSLFVVFWVYNMIQNYESAPDKKKLIDQQTLDILQEELQKVEAKAEEVIED